MTITVDEGGLRLDVYLSKKLDFSRAKVQKLIDDVLVTINNKAVKSKQLTVLNN